MYKKAIYIPFSGGFDSTYTILTVLDNYKKKEKDDCPDINLITIEASIINHKFNRESTARERLLTYFRTEYKNINIDQKIIRLDTKNCSIHGCGMPLLPFFAFMCTEAIDLNYYDEAEIMFSIICGDQVAAYQHELKNIIYNTLAVQYCGLGKDPKEMVKVHFPVITMFKEEILIDLIKRDLKETKSGIILTDTCTCCDVFDSNKMEDCGECFACRCFKSALLNIYNDFLNKQIDSTVRECALDIYKKRFTGTPVQKKKLEHYLDRMDPIITATERYHNPDVDENGNYKAIDTSSDFKYPKSVPTLGGGGENTKTCDLYGLDICKYDSCVDCQVLRSRRNMSVHCKFKTKYNTMISGGSSRILCPIYKTQKLADTCKEYCKLYKEILADEERLIKDKEEDINEEE